MIQLDDRLDYQTYNGLTAMDAEPVPGRNDRARNYTSAEELAAYVNVTLETFKLLAERAQIRPVEIGGQTMYHRTEVKQFLSAWVSWGLSRCWDTESGQKEARDVPERMELQMRGGKDEPGRMQWQTVEDARAKDRWE